jgi:hypothetical protein
MTEEEAKKYLRQSREQDALRLERRAKRYATLAAGVADPEDRKMYRRKVAEAIAEARRIRDILKADLD